MVISNKFSSSEGLSKKELISTNNRDSSYKKDYNNKESREDKPFNKAKVMSFKYQRLRHNNSIIMSSIRRL